MRPTTGPRRADVIAAYDLGVASYEESWSPVILPAAQTLLPWLLPLDHGIVADVGGGSGALAPLIMSAAPSATLITLDASGEMVRAAQARGVQAVRADAMVLPLPAGTVDTVVLAYVLFHLADPLAALAEAARVLRSGGRVGTVTWAWEHGARAQGVWDDALADAAVPAAPLRRVDDGLDTPDGLDSLLRRAGLLPLRIWPHRLRRQWDPASFSELVVGSGVNRQRLGALPPDARAALLTRFRSKLDALQPEDLLWEGKVICAAAAKPNVATDRQ
jgi:SAM-dependent methyltransferase